MKEEVRKIFKSLLFEKHITLNMYFKFLKKTYGEIEELVEVVDKLLFNEHISVDDAMVLVEYLNEQKEISSHELIMPYTSPSIPVTNPGYPTYPTTGDPIPWTLPQVWCDTTNISYSC